jgi:hypothetical protein
MALIFPILTQFDDRAAKKADTAFTKLGKKFAAVFSVAAVVKFGKESVRAFQEAEKEAAQLRSQLEAVNLAFASDFVDDYIDNLALLSGITGGNLNRAFITLSQGTEDVTTAQKLLNAALDISAGTSKDLQTVSNALQRAYKGEVTALARLRIGYTTADLKGRDFNEVLTELTDKFQGASARSAETLAGKMARLAEATDQAKEAFGAGFVKGLEDSNVAVEDLQKSVIDLGDAFGFVTGKAISFYTTLITDVTKSIEEGDDAISKFLRSLVKSQAEASRLEEERGRATLRQRNAILRAEQKNLKIKQESTKLADKEKKDAEKLAKAKAMFDMEQIQIAAALQGKLTEEERTRLLLMKAIVEENATEADRLTEKLAKLQADTEKLATTLIGLKSGDPFEDWDDYFKDAGELLDGLLSKMKGLTSNLNALLTEAQAKSQSAADRVLAAKEERSAAYQEAARATAVSADLAASQAAAAQAEALAVLAAEDSPANREFLEAANAAMDAAQALAESVIAAEEAAALAEADMASMLDFEATFALLELGLQPIPNINVTVEGSVISDQDLAQVIRNESFQYQRSGGLVVFNQVAI